MSTPIPKPNTAEFQRLEYWQGQMLRSQDFRDQEAIASQLQWWHNRALHNAYGVAIGFEVHKPDESNDSDPILVQPGIAYDCYGRELILQQEREVAIPEDILDEDDLTLLVKYKETSAFPMRESWSEVCVSIDTNPFLEEPQFFWMPTRQVKVKDGVPLVRVKDGEITPLDQMKRLARPLARPRIANGATIPGSTAWKLWDIDLVGQGEPFPLGFKVEIDTSAAGFTEVPCYFAWLQGSFWELLAKEETDTAIPGFATAFLRYFPAASDQHNFPLNQFVLAPLTHIAQEPEPTISSFTFRIWMPKILMPGHEYQANQGFEDNFLPLALQQKFHVCWLGIQTLHCDRDQKEVNHGNT